MSTWRAIAAFLLLATTSANAAVTTTLVDVPTRGVVQRILYIKPDAPIANLIALPGADTILDILDDGSLPTKAGNCFPVARLRDAFTGRGLAIALVDTPSDYRGIVLPEEYRIGAEQIADVLEVIRHMQQRADVPTWIIGGTSAASSIVNLAASLPSDVPLGAILFSIFPVSAQLEPGAVRRPTLVVANSFEVLRSQALLDQMGLAPVKELAILTGAREQDCGPRLFEGVETDFVDTVSGFIDRYNVLLQPNSKPVNYQGLFYNAPAESEAGWGINFAHQGDAIFATWFTHDANGNAWNLSMSASETGPNTFAGTLVAVTGPPFGTVPFNQAQVHAVPVGTATLTFSDGNHGTFTYAVNGVMQTKSITRQVFGVLPTCAWGALADLTLATNYTDMWWVVAGVESGWGINFTHQSNAIFATWFTFDLLGNPLPMSATLFRDGTSNSYTGTLIRTGGPPFSAVPWIPGAVTRDELGTATVTFTNGNRATFAYTVELNGPASAVTQSKQIERQVFRTPGTVCQ